jgi:hypothetical protein
MLPSAPPAATDAPSRTARDGNRGTKTTRPITTHVVTINVKDERAW